jgi:hypothetical protein
VVGKKRPGKRIEARLSVEKMPEVIASLRHELAEILRDVAEIESDPRVARRLREIAASFEAGQFVK